MNKAEIIALAESAEAAATATPAQAEVLKSPDFWKNPHLRYKENNEPYAPSITAITWWMEHPSMQLSHVRYNQLEGVIEAELLPWNQKPHTWSDADTSYLLATLQERTSGLVRSEKNVLHALTIVAHNKKYDPLLDALESLPEWDGIPRADSLVIDFLGAADTAYTRAVTRHMLNGAVMRAFVPGCKFDEVVTLSSQKQGIGKSTFARKLALRDSFFTDSVGNITTKEAPENLKGRWIIELGELESLRKREVESVKLFISKQDDRFRPSYGRFAETFKRRFIFIASTNSTAFLTDRTGNRRFLPIACNVQPPRLSIFSDEATEHIKQAWAEVLNDYQTNGSLPLVLPDSVKDTAEEQRDRFAVDDPKAGLIESWITDHCRPGELICILQIMDKVFDITKAEANKPTNKAMQNEIRQILESLPYLTRMDKKPYHSQEFGYQRCWKYQADD